MNGRLFYFSIAALMATLARQQNTSVFLILFLIFTFFLIRVKKMPIAGIGIVIFVFSLFFAIAHLAEQSNQTKIPSNTTQFNLAFNDEVIIDGDLLSAVVSEVVHREKIRVLYRLQTEDEKKSFQKNLQTGMFCRVKAVLKKPGKARNPNSFDYEQFLSRKRIYWLAEIHWISLHDCTPLPPTPLLWIKKMRSEGISIIKTVFPQEIAPLASALIFGDRHLFAPQLIEVYQKIGIIHLLAISGLHVSLLAGMLFYLGIRAGIKRETMKKMLYVILPIYAILAGGAPSVNRSVIMLICIIYFSNKRSSFKLMALDALSVSFLILVLLDSMVVYDIGFQLSFSVSAGLILSAPFILRVVDNRVLQLLVTSYISQLASLPLLLHYFFGVSLLGLITNLLYIPFFSLMLMPGLFLLFFLQLIFGVMPQPLSFLLTLMTVFSDKIAQVLSKWNFFDITTGRYTPLVSVLLAVIILAVFVFWEKTRNNKRLLVVFSIPWLFILSQKMMSEFNPYGEITMIDVGQGDSILIQMPYNDATYLIDTGGSIAFEKENWQVRSDSFDVGKDVVLPFLRGKGISEIDKLILTHGDLDHIGGALAILEGMTVNEVVLPAVLEKSHAEMTILQKARQKGNVITEASKGDYWKSGDTVFRILHPKRGYKGETNGGSIVLSTRLGGRDWLFTGDLDQNGEEILLKEYSNMQVDVLKAGHHGSQTSSTKSFLQKYKPEVALISVGENNRYGHPHPDVLKNFKNVGSRVYRTDFHGAITYRFSKGSGTFYTYLPYNKTNQ